MNTIKLSIVMATYNRVELLAKQLKAFESQSINRSEYEIIIVNDGSIDGTEKFLDQQLFLVSNLKVINQKNSGPAAARNNGVKHAISNVIAFTDDDCIVDPHWAQTIISRFESETIKVLEGQTYTDKALRTPLTHQIENLVWNPVIPTCNAAYRKDFFEQLGGFDESFPYPHNEDTDLAWRVLDETTVEFCEEMKVFHPPIPVKFKSQLRRMRMLVSEFSLYNKNKTAYKKWRASNPWLTIYKEVFFKHQLLNLKFHLGFYNKPKLLLKGVALSIGWWIYLIVLFPKFIQESLSIKG